MRLDELTLGDVKQLQGLLSGQTQAALSEVSLGKQIVILQRGWVMVGDMFKRGHDCRLENASVIRIWGTERGLGELAKSGPLGKTKLDPCPDVRFHELTTIAIIECDKKSWK